MLKMYVLDLGRMKLDKNLIVNHSVQATSVEPNKQTEFIEIPIQAYLFETENKYILFDTGVHSSSMGESGRWTKKTQREIPYYGTEEDSILYRLKQFGLTPDDISLVILSHMHCDHAGCVEYFKNSNLLVNENEFNACIHAYAIHDIDSYIWKDTDTWIKYKHKWNFIDENEGDLQISPELRVLNFGPGHSRGMLGLHVQLKNTGNIIITSDAVYCNENFGEPLKGSGVVYDTVGWRRTAKRIKKLAIETGAQVWFGHDLNQFKSIIKSTEGYYD